MSQLETNTFDLQETSQAIAKPNSETILEITKLTQKDGATPTKGCVNAKYCYIQVIHLVQPAK